jgi:hypothetical protein
MNRPTPLQPAFQAFALAFLALSTVGAAEDRMQFNRDIRPILSENCFACHGRDAKKREAKLRLDIAEGPFKPNDDGDIAITPGDLAKSEVWERINSTDKDDMMPPPKSHKTLTAAQRITIKRWIEQGAPYQKHWAFERPVRPALPGSPTSSGNPIDALAGGRSANAPAPRHIRSHRVAAHARGSGRVPRRHLSRCL